MSDNSVDAVKVAKAANELKEIYVEISDLKVAIGRAWERIDNLLLLVQEETAGEESEEGSEEGEQEGAESDDD